MFEIMQLNAQHVSVFAELIGMFNTVFEEESKIGSEAHLIRLLDDEHFVTLTARIDNRVIAGLTAYELPLYYRDSSEMFLYDLAVQPDYQRMGIGNALLQGLKDYCREHGIEEFFVMAHAEDQHAIEFYHATGGKAEKAVNFLYAADGD